MLQSTLERSQRKRMPSSCCWSRKGQACLPHILLFHGVVRWLYLLLGENSQYLYSAWISRTLFHFLDRVHLAPRISPGASLVKHVSSPQGRAIHCSVYNSPVSENNLSNDMIHIYTASLCSSKCLYKEAAVKFKRYLLKIQIVCKVY